MLVESVVEPPLVVVSPPPLVVEVELAEVVDPDESEVAESVPEPELSVVAESLALPEVLGLVVVGLVALVAVAESLSDPLEPSSDEQAARRASARTGEKTRELARSRHVIDTSMRAANGPENRKYADALSGR